MHLGRRSDLHPRRSSNIARSSTSPLEDARAGITNCLLLPGEVLCDSNIMELGKESPKYPIEKSKIDRLETICSRFGRTLRVFCMSEFYKSGALLSCLIMHIKQNADSTQITPIVAMRQGTRYDQRRGAEDALSFG